MGEPAQRNAGDDGATPWAALALITALAVVLRSISLDSGLWYDEIRTLQDSVRSPFWRIVTVFPGDNQHTFFSLLAHASMAVFGDHVWSLRLPSMLLGAATVPLLFFLAREFTGRTEALLASLLLAVTYHHIWYSQSARGYATLGFATVLCSWLLLRGLRRQRLSDFLWYGVVAALGIYTHVTIVFLVASHALLCVLPLGFPTFDRDKLARWKLPLVGFALAAVLSALLYAPFLFEVREKVVTAPSPVRNANSTWALLELLRGLQIGLGSLAAVLAGGALFAAGLWSYLRQSRFITGLFLLPGVMTVGAAVVLHRPVRPRFVLFLLGFALLVIVRGALEIGRLLQRRTAGTRHPEPVPSAQNSVVGWSGVGAFAESPSPVGIALVLLLAAVSAASLPVLYRYPKQDFAGALRYVEAERTEDEPVLTAGPATYPYASYFERKWQGIKTTADLATARATGHRVWVLYTLASYIESDDPALASTLRDGCEQRRDFRGTLGGGDITVCSLPPVAPSR